MPTCAEGAAHPGARVACPGARAGMTIDECARLGCCFTAGPSPGPNHDPWCFLGSDAPPPAERPPLFVFAEPLEENPPAPEAEGVVYFGPGMHDPNPNVSRAWCPLTKAKPTLYVAPGACECLSCPCLLHLRPQFALPLMALVRRCPHRNPVQWH
jgi:hypothetical protein